MAVEKSAVREGTRWMRLGDVVWVEEVSDRFVIFRAGPRKPVQVVTLDGFAKIAHPVSRTQVDYADLRADLTFAAEAPYSATSEAVMICLLRDAVLHLLDRVGPPTAEVAR